MMKNTPLIFLMFFGYLLLGACSNKDSEFYNELTLKVPNQLVIETQNTYAVQDTLWLHTAISRYLPEENQSNLLDIFQTSGQAPRLLFSYVLEKKEANGDWVFYSMTSNLVQELGIVSAYEGYYLGHSVYSDSTKKYEFRSGFKLTEAGEYRLYFGYESLATRAVLLRSESLAQNIIVNIQSSVSSLDQNGYYTFTVN